MYDGNVAVEDARGDPRTHILLVATLYHDSGTVPVRVRNLSPRGALLEGSVFPQPGSRVILRRGKLEASGKVVRATGGKAGIQFDQTVHVQAWLPVKGSPAQHSVDHFAAAVDGLLQATNPVPAGAPRVRSPADISAGLTLVQLELVALGEKLSNDCILVATHPEVQFLDSAIQRIAKLVEALGALEAGEPRRQEAA